MTSSSRLSECTGTARPASRGPAPSRRVSAQGRRGTPASPRAAVGRVHPGGDHPARRAAIPDRRTAAAAIPEDLRDRLAPAEIFHEILEYRWYMSEHAGRDVGTTAAAAPISSASSPGPGAAGHRHQL